MKGLINSLIKYRPNLILVGHGEWNISLFDINSLAIIKEFIVEFNVSGIYKTNKLIDTYIITSAWKLALWYVQDHK